MEIKKLITFLKKVYALGNFIVLRLTFLQKGLGELHWY